MVNRFHIKAPSSCPTIFIENLNAYSKLEHHMNHDNFELIFLNIQQTIIHKYITYGLMQL